MTTIRPRIGRYALIGFAVIAASALIATAVAGAFRAFPTLLASLLAFLAAIWAMFIEPRIWFSESELEVRNPLRVLRISWAAVDSFETKYGLTVVSGTKKFVAWSAPAPTRREVRKLNSRDLIGTPLQGLEYIEPGTTAHSESGMVLNQLLVARAACTSDARTLKVSFNWLGFAAIAAAIGFGYLALHL